jgi:hypothetical protein
MHLQGGYVDAKLKSWQGADGQRQQLLMVVILASGRSYDGSRPTGLFK